MFKSLQLKLVTIFVLLVLAIMTVAGTFLVLRVYTYHGEKFYSDLNSVFTHWDPELCKNVPTPNEISNKNKINGGT